MHIPLRPNQLKPPSRASWFPALRASVQARRFQEAVAICGDDARLERATGAVNSEGNLNARVAQSPNAAEEACQSPNRPACNGEHDIPRFHTGPVAGSLRRHAEDDDLILGFA